MTSSSSHLFSTPMLAEQDFILGRHLQQCRKSQGQWLYASIWLERAHQIVATRFFTTVGIATVVIMLGSWWI